MGRKNVLMIVADQWRGDGIHALGAGHVVTPTLDALAADGVAFTSHYGQAIPCAPSRASLFTGKYLMNHRVAGNGTPLDARHSNLALQVRRAGYDPVLFGYTDTTHDPRGLHPADPHRHTYEGVLPGVTPGLVLREDARPWLAALGALGYPGDLTRETAYRARPDFVIPPDRGASFAPPIYAAEHSDTAFLTDRALDWLAGFDDQPWFMLLCYLRPHPPLIAPEPYNALIDPADVPMPRRAATREQEARQHPFTDYLIRTKRFDELVPGGDGLMADVSERDLRQLRATHYGLMAEVDAHIGRIVARLKERGQYEDTLIVFTSDHADELGEHYLCNKSSYFDEAVHIPLIVRDPAAAPGARGTRIGAFTEAIDLMPTILDWLELEVPEDVDGASLLPFLRGRNPEGWRDAVHWEKDFRDVRNLEPERWFGLSPDQCAFAVIRDDQYKYIHFSGLPPAFYDLREDPHQLVNRAGDPALRDRELDYARKMLTWRMLHADRTLTNMSAGPGGIREWRGPRIVQSGD
ncbi:MAG: alkaline phosphatase family protein [Alphaproteobacteria bacterium]|nr:alkaline phosphatase family protein [Alphaproteobacteria bacterium]